MQSEESRKYRFAMNMTIVFAIGSLVLLAAHYTIGILSDKTATLLLVGIAFWMLMFAGYRADWKERSSAEHPPTP